MTRGTACLNCWRRKVKCDGLRPTCGPCSKSSTLNDCEYLEAGLPESQLLQEKISILENRIQELQTSGHGASSSTVQLHHPYSNQFEQSSSRGPEVNSSFLREFQAASPDRRRMIIMPFLSHASELGFFLDISLFSSGVETGSCYPSPSLLSAVLLLADYVSHGGGANEADFLALAVQSTSRGLTDSHPKMILHTIQANILLAHYFQLKGKSVEGQYYTSTAVSLILGTGLHRIRSSDPGSMSGSHLPRPKDALEEGERINAVWAVVALNSFWSAAGRYPSNIDHQLPASRVDAPWPLETPGYISEPLPHNLRSSHTILNFLSNVPDGAYSLPALYSKACLLFEQASILNYQYSPNMPTREEGRQFSRSCDQLSAVLKRFNAELPSPSTATTVPAQRRLLVIYTLSHVAVIQLHYAFVGQNADSRRQVLSTANSIVKCLKSIGLQHFNGVIDPVFAVLLKIVGKVFIAELASSAPSVDPRLLASSVELVMKAMSILGGPGSFMSSQATVLQGKYTGIKR
ncbi:hypothetical protein E1B28_010327 [Marasmius oreades]|uniref:Zn(2)-C6 fungal-type domain-containing protein n=1 Tax=Marasmius oreades TaxID=181124 RepID=A0A9P7URD1_9AGAR|nr:uncharacterized protein E1B28_010327 [Marasmius oreades]KAG7091278.1 hypothetical protein E1B28_010327 [Marasmius oreades]